MICILSISAAHILLSPLHAWLHSYTDHLKFRKYQNLSPLRAFILRTSFFLSLKHSLLSPPKQLPCFVVPHLLTLPSFSIGSLLSNSQVSASMSPPQRGSSSPLHFYRQLTRTAISVSFLVLTTKWKLLLGLLICHLALPSVLSSTTERNLATLFTIVNIKYSAWYIYKCSIKIS